MSFVAVPPLPGETLLRVRAVAMRAGCSRDAIYNAIRDRKITACIVAGHYFIAESEAERFIREWPSKNRGVSARWAEYRAWKQRRAAEAA